MLRVLNSPGAKAPKTEKIAYGTTEQDAEKAQLRLPGLKPPRENASVAAGLKPRPSTESDFSSKL
jgi:hypothetical protein